MSKALGDSYRLCELAADIWTVDRAFYLFGIYFGNRMTIIRVNDRLLLHSPVAFDEELGGEVSRLGFVSALVAPNTMHYLHVEGWKDKYSHATLIAPASLKRITPDARFSASEIAEWELQWKGEIRIIPVNGLPKLEEYVLLHVPSGTLILTDLAFNIQSTPNFFSKLFFKAYGAYGQFGATRLIQSLIKDHEAFRLSMNAIMQTDFDRIVVSHGDVIECNGKAIFQKTFEHV